MSLLKVRAALGGLLMLMLVLVLVACGGGGGGSSDAGTPVLPGTASGSGSGTGTKGPSVTLAVSSPTVTVLSPVTVTVTVRDAAGKPISGVVVALSTERGTLAALSVASVATDTNGSATATLGAATGGVSGADQVLAVAALGTTTVNGSVSFTVAGSAPTIGLSITSTTLRASTGAETLRALVKDAVGNPVPDLLIAFSTLGGHVNLGATSAKTDAQGFASVTAAVVDSAVSAADTLTASATVGAVDAKSSLVVQLVADVPSLMLTASGSTVTAAVPVTLSILVSDAAGKPVGAGTVVTVSSSFGLSAFDANTASTNSSGVAQVTVSPQAVGSNGADQIVAKATVGGTSVTAQAVLQVSSLSMVSVAMTVSPALITLASPATVSMTLRDASGKSLSGTVVDLSTVRGTLATLSVSSVTTDANGIATAKLTAISGGRGGADQVVGVVKSGSTTVQGSASFTVAGTSATMSLSISSATLRGSTGAATLSAVVKDAVGNPMSGIQVAFASAGKQVNFGAASAMTDATGSASASVVVANPGVTAADTVTANATVGSVALQSSVVVQILADTPTITITPSNTNVTINTPATLAILVKDGAGNAVGAGTVVTVNSVLGLSTFDAGTAVTNAGGVAQVVVSPKTSTSNGADQIVTTATVGGVTVSAQTVLQILNSTTNVVTVALSSGTITAVSPSTVTVTVRDLRGNPVSGAVVDLSTLRGNLASLSVASVATGTGGSATAVLSVAAGAISGADQFIGQIRGGTAATQGSAAFTVLGSAPTLSLTISPSNTLRGSTDLASPKTLAAVVRDVGGNLVPNVQVAFSALGAKVKLGASSAKTDGNGLATIPVSVADASVTAADTLSASATVNGLTVQASLVVQLLADRPSLSVSASNSNVTAAAPATLSILVKDSAGLAVGAGTIVKVSSLFGLSSFDAATSSTNSSGVAAVTVTPKSANSNGADQIEVTSTVGGVTVTAPFVVQVSSSNLNAPPVLQTSLSSTAVSAASPATVTAILSDGKGQAVAGAVITFSVVRGLGKTNLGTALTDASGKAVVILSPVSSTIAGADEVSASASFAGTALQSTKGFQIQATNVALPSLTSAIPSLGAYGQTTLTLGITGASVGSPVNVSVTSSCVSQGKASLSPLTFAATSASVALQYKDNGCGALQAEDKLQASIVGGSASASLSLPVATPMASSLAFVSASPEVIYIKGSGFTETSTVTFEVRDGAGNTLPNRSVTLSLLTRGGGVAIEGGIADVSQVSDASGRVTVRVNAGTLPTPIRVSATLTGVLPVVATVSSNLSVAVGLPSQLNFSLAQATKNIEGFNIDGTPNSYNIIASDRSGNPVPAGTSINFVAEGGQIESIKQIQLASGLARTTAGFVSSNPRPADGRITVTAYALGEESFIDQNGNNIHDPGEPFQDLGNVFKDRVFDGFYDVSLDEYVPTNIANTSACVAAAAAAGATAATTALLALDPSIPSMGGSTCDGSWSGGGKVYVRRATETVLSTSAARVLWAGKSGLDASCQAITLQTGPQPTATSVFTPVLSGQVWYGAGASIALPFIVADANTFSSRGPNGSVGRFNPMAAGTTVTASTPTTGLKVTLGGGSPVPSTTEASSAAVGVSFDTVSAGVVFVTFTSPSGVASTYAINVQQTTALNPKPSDCP